jgi:hypothetical protein
MKIFFQDQAIRIRSQENVQQLLQDVQQQLEHSADKCSNSALLAKKALKYRKVYDRLAGVDVTSPEFDASEFMGVEWCHTPCLKTHCASYL